MFARSMRFVLAVAGSIVCGTAAAAAGTDFSDQWWNPAESGWGVSILQQSNVIFVDLFAYGGDGVPVWYTASASTQGPNDQGHVVFSGDLFATHGPSSALPFDPSQVVYRKVGTLTFDAEGVDSANLVYQVDGVAVNRKVIRQSWKAEDFSGSYYGAFIYDYMALHAPCPDVHAEEVGPIKVAQSGDGTIALTIQSAQHNCTFSGALTQAGRMGSSQGTFACSDSLNGTYTAFEMQKNGNGITGRFAGESRFCSFTGRFGGVLR